MSPALNIILRSIDPDAARFCARSGAQDKQAIHRFVRGMKGLGLWGSLVCWPLRSTQNAGTGSTAYSLGGRGTHNSTLVNGPTWGLDGVSFTAASSHSMSLLDIPSAPFSLLVIGKRISGSGNSSWDVIHTTGAVRRSIAKREYGASFGVSISGVANCFVTGTYPTGDACASNLVAMSTNTNSTGTMHIDKAALSPSTSSGDWSSGSVGTDPVFRVSVGGGALVYQASLILISNVVIPTTIHDFYRDTLGAGLGLP